jgi:hypothetical protein
MLDLWIVEDIRRREVEREYKEERVVVEMPLEPLPMAPEASPPPSDRGVVVIDFG